MWFPHKVCNNLFYFFSHYPLSKSFTQVNDTPEMQQVAINTKNMSKVSSHLDGNTSQAVSYDGAI